MKKRLIMVMGVQRSGTTALFKSLACDPMLTAYHENVDDPLYYLFRLRPVEEIAPILDAAPGPVLLKPITETLYRSLEDLRAEYHEYALRVVWIYRDPVNVLYSISRQAWLTRELEGELGAGNWVSRNRFALEFQAAHPRKITILRYEDLLADARVFRSLCKSLGVRATPVFREDRAAGRVLLPLETQGAIDSATRATIQALDSARTFKPGRLSRWKFAATASLQRTNPRRGTLTTTYESPREWKKKIANTPPQFPSQVEDLVFWLDADRLSSHEGRVQEVKEFGPFGLRAAVDAQPPFCIPMFNLRSVLLFPTTKATDRVQGNPGLLRFVLAEKKRCDSLDESFSGFALLNPICRSRTQRDKQRMVSLRLRSDDGKTDFILEWDGAERALTATLRTSEQSQLVTTAANAHPNKQWRVIYFQWQKGSEGRLSITVDGISSETQLAQRLNPSGSHSHPKWTIELGGSETDPAALFYGAIAEIILFTRPLRPNEQLAIVSYLKQKFHW